MLVCRNELVPAYVKLLRDTEAEVRVAAAGKVSAVCQMLTPDRVITSIVPCVKELAADSSQHVRAALASVVMEIAPVLGKSATIEHLLPVFLSLLKDDFPDVRLNIISKLDQVNQVHKPHCCPPAYLLTAVEQQQHLLVLQNTSYSYCKRVAHCFWLRAWHGISLVLSVL